MLVLNQKQIYFVVQDIILEMYCFKHQKQYNKTIHTRHYFHLENMSALVYGKSVFHWMCTPAHFPSIVEYCAM